MDRYKGGRPKGVECQHQFGGKGRMKAHCRKTARVMVTLSVGERQAKVTRCWFHFIELVNYMVEASDASIMHVESLQPLKGGD
jgi:hypothetical protein